VSVRGPSAVELLEQGTGFLTRTHLRDLGLERRAVDAVFGHCPVIQFAGYSRPVIEVEAFIAFKEGSTYCARCRDRVRPGRRRYEAAPRTAPGSGRANGAPPD
jgi:hypothetical protein